MTTVIVDGGYLVAGVGHFLTKTSRPAREDIRLHASDCASVLKRLAGDERAPILWYDGHREDRDMSAEHQALLETPGVSLRLGPLRRRSTGLGWEQKRVDAMIQRDMVNLARAGERDIALVAGDEDLVIAVEEARRCGAEVTLISTAVANEFSTSPHLIAAANRHIVMSGDDVMACANLSARAGISQVASAMRAMAS